MTENPKDLKALAAALGTDRKSIRRWIGRFRSECPQPVEGRHDPAKWRRFMEDNLLGPFSARMAYGEAANPTPPAASASAGDGAFFRGDWRDRRGMLFELMELVHAGYASGELNIEQYFNAGEATARAVVALGTAWQAGIDARGFLKNWRAILAEAALRENEENKARRRA